MEPSQIFDLIRRADERLKYVHGASASAARAAARELLERARDEARAAALEELVRQAEVRLEGLAEGVEGIAGEVGPPPG